MNSTTLDFALALLDRLPGLIGAGVRVVAMIEETLATIRRAQAEQRDPTDAEWDALHQKIAALRSALDAPEE